VAAEPLFFAFDNGVGRGNSTPVQQATMLKELGYGGIGYTGTGNLAERQRAFAEAGLVITSLYVACKIGSPPTCDAGLLESLPLLKDRGIALWLTVHGQGDDAAAAAAVRLVAEPAAKLGVPVVLYPHHGFRVATAEQAVPIVEQVALPNVGLTINLCHELRRQWSASVVHHPCDGQTPALGVDQRRRCQR
jgi:sugar phosphate isomerase/epimerase